MRPFGGAFIVRRTKSNYGLRRMSCEMTLITTPGRQLRARRISLGSGSVAKKTLPLCGVPDTGTTSPVGKWDFGVAFPAIWMVACENK